MEHLDEILIFLGGVIAQILGKMTFKKLSKDEKAKDSHELLREQVETLHIKLSELFEHRLVDAQAKLELELTINRLKAECPDCVDRILKIIEAEKAQHG